jgi:hypothetical protein
MCNAFGHLLSCRCGWGRPGEICYTNVYPARQQTLLQDFAASFYANPSFSITKPNYKCKWCGTEVFFFKSSNGGKVLFDALGKPWPIHNCLGIKYERKKSKLKISFSDWMPVTHFSVLPSNKQCDSCFFGLISSLDDENQYEIKLFIDVEDLILVRDLYLKRGDYEAGNASMEVLLLFDDGHHQLTTCTFIERKLFVLNDLLNKIPLTTQIKLI